MAVKGWGVNTWIWFSDGLLRTRTNTHEHV